MTKKTYHVELNPTDAEKYKYFLKTNCIQYEASACYDLIHFSTLLNTTELEKANQFLETL